MPVVPDAGYWPSDEFSSVILEAYDLGITIQALGIRFSGPPQITRDETNCWALIKEIKWEGSSWREYLVKLAAATTGDATTLYAPNTLIKMGAKKYRKIQVGELSQHRALTAARWYLKQGLSRIKLRTYGTSSPPSPLPDRGDTIQAADGFIGVCISRLYEVKAGGLEYLEVRILDMDSGAD